MKSRLMGRERRATEERGAAAQKDRSATTDESQEEKRSRRWNRNLGDPGGVTQTYQPRFRRSVATSGAFRDQARGARLVGWGERKEQ
ncbi:hypothetical protein NDU88_009189 [Pleurodeles waltl]|uniref:Uncharacterized protein n=1 Tax=Pleurodeles waltl TaxID=8319 RepID=A0AAV7RUI8_PLEWA|nr:hypothetical protein NDU88_009175 [Pleurodeles waltl]KAJ1156470.1 hypothetical protein NDU88_009189 [Pleurodeles waltl]